MFDSLIHLQDSQTEEGKAILTPQVWFTYSLTRLSNYNKEGSNAILFDSLIHLQDSQTQVSSAAKFLCLIHLFTYKTLKLRCERFIGTRRLIHLFTYKTLKRLLLILLLYQCLIHLFTYKTLKRTTCFILR